MIDPLLARSSLALVDIAGGPGLDIVLMPNVIPGGSVTDTVGGFGVFEYRGPGVYAEGPVLPRHGRKLLLSDFDEDGALDVALPTASTTQILLNRTRFFDCLRGNVNKTLGNPENVLLINGSPGLGRNRTLYLDAQNDPLEVRVESPSSAGAGSAPFVLYAYRQFPRPETRTPLQFGLGDACLPMPMNAPNASISPVVVWNNIAGFDSVLGTADLPSAPAPSVIIKRTRLKREGDFSFQGLIFDSNSPQGQLAVTNSISVLSRSY